MHDPKNMAAPSGPKYMKKAKCRNISAIEKVEDKETRPWFGSSPSVPNYEGTDGDL